MMTCSKCGAVDQVEMTVFPLEELHAKKDGTKGREAKISEDCLLR